MGGLCYSRESARKGSQPNSDFISIWRIRGYESSSKRLWVKTSFFWIVITHCHELRVKPILVQHYSSTHRFFIFSSKNFIILNKMRLEFKYHTILTNSSREISNSTQIGKHLTSLASRATTFQMYFSPTLFCYAQRAYTSRYRCLFVV